MRCRPPSSRNAERSMTRQWNSDGTRRLAEFPGLQGLGPEDLHDLTRVISGLFLFHLIEIAYRSQHVLESRPAVTVIGRKIGSSKKRLLVRHEKHTQRP